MGDYCREFFYSVKEEDFEKYKKHQNMDEFSKQFKVAHDFKSYSHNHLVLLNRFFKAYDYTNTFNIGKYPYVDKYDMCYHLILEKDLKPLYDSLIKLENNFLNEPEKSEPFLRKELQKCISFAKDSYTNNTSSNDFFKKKMKESIDYMNEEYDKIDLSPKVLLKLYELHSGDGYFELPDFPKAAQEIMSFEKYSGTLKNFFQSLGYLKALLNISLKLSNDRSSLLLSIY